MKYHFKVYKEDHGYWAQCLDFEGCQTQGDTIEELEKNLKEVLDLCLNEPLGSKVIPPLPKKITAAENIMLVDPHPTIAFAVLLKNIRHEKNMTQKQVATKLGMKNIYSYQKLEKKANPTLTTLAKIYEVFPEISFNDIFA
jgi:antitoxin HicB